ncbi:MAG: ribonuclease R [Alistipes sp.]|nr:ribonuclease R [Alistipes sp.]
MKERKTKRTNKKSKKIGFNDRAGFIVNAFREMPEKRFTLKYLAAASGGADKEGRNLTKHILDTLLEQGYIEAEGKGKYHLSRSKMPRYEGVVDMAASGAMYVQCEELDSDVFVHQRNTHNALNGDRVEVIITHTSRNGAKEGEISKVLERSPRCYAGRVEIASKTMAIVVPDSRKIPVDIAISLKKYPDLKQDDKVAVRIVDWRDGDRLPQGELVDILGAAGDNDAEMHAILLEYNLPYKFEEQVEKAANAIDGRITDRDIAERRDMRRVPTLTIDPADAKDFDDALSIQPIGEGKWEVGVHIADVTHYVRPDTTIDDEAIERGTSVYLVDRTIPMLPERLCNDLCSLRPHEDKLAFSAVFHIDEKGKISQEWFGRTIIHSDRRFTYEEAQKVIETGAGDMKEEILTMHNLAQTLRKERFRKGAIAFSRREAKFHLDENGKPTGVYFKVQKEANQLIEEFMLLANRRVAEFCAKAHGKERTMIFRVHDTPNSDKFERFRTFILRFGHIFKSSIEKGNAAAKELNKLLASIKGKAEENVVSTLAIRSMAKAVYTTDNIGHYGLAFPYYTHFTSPIRRYPDMMVHRLLQRYLDGKRSADKDMHESLCVRCSEREVIAAEAERASIKYKMVEFMADKIGEEFDGHISGMSEWGIFVELEDSIVEGMMLMRDIPGDYYQFDEERYEVYGHSTGKVFTIGDKVRIRVKSADLRRRLLDFEYVSSL